MVHVRVYLQVYK